MKNILLSFEIDPDLKQKLKIQSVEERRSIKEIMDNLISDYLKKNGK